MLLCVASVATLAYLGNLPLLDPDEPVYAETAREMLQFQDFISPRIYGEFWYDKPPMYYWLVAAAFKIFGIGEFAARLPSALLAIGGSVVVYLSGRKLFNERTGLLAGLVLATSLEYFYLGKAAVTDITLTFFLTLALLAYLHNRYDLLFIGAALAVVTKGPIGIIFCAAIIGLHVIVTKNWAVFKQMKVLRGTILFLIIALPWYVLMYQYHGIAFIETFLGFHNVTRFLKPEHPSGTLWYYYVPVLIFGFFPWTAFMLQACKAALRQRNADWNRLVFLVIWAVTVFVFFSMSQTKLVSYILPMYPPLALLVGWYFDKAWSEKRFSILKWSAAMLTVVAVILEADLFYLANTMPELYVSGMVAATVFIAANAFVWWFSSRRDFRSVFTVNVVAMLFFSIYLVAQLLPVIAPAYSMKTLVEDFNQHYDGHSQVYVTKFYRPGFMFYSGIPGNELTDDDTFKTLLVKDETAFFIVKAQAYKNLPAPLQNDIIVLAANEDKALLYRKGKI